MAEFVALGGVEQAAEDDDARPRHLGEHGDVAVEGMDRVRALRQRRLGHRRRRRVRARGSGLRRLDLGDGGQRRGAVPAAGDHRADDVVVAPAGVPLLGEPAAQFEGDDLRAHEGMMRFCRSRR